MIAAIALFLGGIPPVFFLITVPSLFGVVRAGLTIAWIISGIASCYLLYAWNAHHQKLFGEKNQADMAAFFVSVVSGINLGLAGILNRNIGMNIIFDKTIFLIVGLIYLASAWRLYSRWKSSGEKLL